MHFVHYTHQVRWSRENSVMVEALAREGEMACLFGILLAPDVTFGIGPVWPVFGSLVRNSKGCTYFAFSILPLTTDLILHLIFLFSGQTAGTVSCIGQWCDWQLASQENKPDLGISGWWSLLMLVVFCLFCMFCVAGFVAVWICMSLLLYLPDGGGLVSEKRVQQQFRPYILLLFAQTETFDSSGVLCFPLLLTYHAGTLGNVVTTQINLTLCTLRQWNRTFTYLNIPSMAKKSSWICRYLFILFPVS